MPNNDCSFIFQAAKLCKAGYFKNTQITDKSNQITDISITLQDNAVSMNTEVKVVNNICEYDDMVGAETLHPLVNVVDFSRLPPVRNIGFKRLFGYYAIYLKGHKYSELSYGSNTYHYDDGALVFVAPGQVAGVEDDGLAHKMTTRVLMFHPDLLHGTYLQPMMGRYTYFSYNSNEAIFPTEEEKRILIYSFNRIEEELGKRDGNAMPIVIDHIKLVLDYCARFYYHRFSGDIPKNKDILARLEELLDGYFNSPRSVSMGIPTVGYCAGQLCLSTNYFSDLVRTATGLSALKLIHGKMLEVAKAKLSDPSKRINEVAMEMGFQQSQSFHAWFKKAEGCTPLQYRKAVVE